MVREYRVIAKRDDGALLVTNSDSANINTIKELGFLISSTGVHLSPVLPIGTITKNDNFEIVNEVFSYEEDIVKNSLLGFAIGDAFGVPYEFEERNKLRTMGAKLMVGNKSHAVEAGSWSDDTSMILATMSAIIEDKNINYVHIMNNFIKWINESEFTPNNETFGIGKTVLRALNNYVKGLEPLRCGCSEIRSNGNGSLMRILPFSLYCINSNMDNEETLKIICEASSLTHSNDISKMSCYIYTEFLREIINTKNPLMALEYIQSLDYSNFEQFAIDAHKKILDNQFVLSEDKEIKSTGYVVDTLESVIYSLLNSYDYESSIVFATELGGDTDTIAALTGAISGIVYGIDFIPNDWINKLKRIDYIEQIALDFNFFLKKQLKNDILKK